MEGDPDIVGNDVVGEGAARHGVHAAMHVLVLDVAGLFQGQVLLNGDGGLWFAIPRLLMGPSDAVHARRFPAPH
jgi:hypothetical protein